MFNPRRRWSWRRLTRSLWGAKLSISSKDRSSKCWKWFRCDVLENPSLLRLQVIMWKRFFLLFTNCRRKCIFLHIFLWKYWICLSRKVEENDDYRRNSFSLGEAYLALQKYENDSRVIATRLNTTLYSGEGSSKGQRLFENLFFNQSGWKGCQISLVGNYFEMITNKTILKLKQAKLF